MEGETARQRGFDAGRDVDGRISDCPYDSGKPRLIEKWVLGFGQGRETYIGEISLRRWPEGIVLRNGMRPFGSTSSAP